MKNVFKQLYHYFKIPKKPRMTYDFNILSFNDSLPMDLPSGKLFYLDFFNWSSLSESDKLIDAKNQRLIKYKMSNFPVKKREKELKYNPIDIDQDYYL